MRDPSQGRAKQAQRLSRPCRALEQGMGLLIQCCDHCSHVLHLRGVRGEWKCNIDAVEMDVVRHKRTSVLTAYDVAFLISEIAKTKEKEPRRRQSIGARSSVEGRSFTSLHFIPIFFPLNGS
jgi:hypothetical protein